MASSMDDIKSLISPRSSGVIKVRLSAVSTSRVISSASFSRLVISRQHCTTLSPPFSKARRVSAPARVTCAWRLKRSKKRSSLGIKARNQPSIRASLRQANRDRKHGAGRCSDQVINFWSKPKLNAKTRAALGPRQRTQDRHGQPGNYADNARKQGQDRPERNDIQKTVDQGRKDRVHVGGKRR